jgi:hypothetical protein
MYMKKLYGGSVLVALIVLSVFSISTRALAAGPAAINLGSAANFTVLAKTGISTTGSTLITGDIGVSPVAATAITGFGLTASTDTTYSTSPVVVGKIYAANYTAPTPTTLTTAISDMQTAYTDGAGRTNPTATELGAGNIGGLTIAPGLYKWGTGVTIPTNVTLSGGANDVWIFQIAQTLTVSSGVKIMLAGGAQASNVFWVVAGQTTIGTTAEFNGTILGQTAIVLNTGAKLNGRALAQTAVTLDANAVTRSSSATTVVPSVQTVNNSSTNTSVTSPANSPIITANPKPIVISANPIDPGCIIGNNFSSTTGLECLTFVKPNNSPQTANDTATYGQTIVSITIDLHKGMRDDTVAVLQQFLILQSKGSSTRALAQVGATAYFGELTRMALAEFQGQVGIYPASGYFGPLTRGYLSRTY